MQQPIIVTVDVVLLTLRDGQLHTVVMDRTVPPFEGSPALPGGYVHAEDDRDTVDAAQRILLRKTGIVAPYLEQLRTFSGPSRDPRGWSVSVAYYALVGLASLERFAEKGGWRLASIDELPELAFDHADIVAAAVQRVRDKSSYSSLPCYLLAEQFTITELQHAYEQVLGSRLDKSAFRRKLADLGFLEAVPGAILTGHRRPTQLYRVRADERLALFDRTL